MIRGFFHNTLKRTRVRAKPSRGDKESYIAVFTQRAGKTTDIICAGSFLWSMLNLYFYAWGLPSKMGECFDNMVNLVSCVSSPSRNILNSVMCADILSSRRVVHFA